jgi:hypothetical protein
MKSKIVSFEEFAHVCPYFTCDTAVNNGYGCTHPEQTESDPDDEHDGKEHGKCYDFSCPLCFTVEEEDFDQAKNPDCDMDGLTLDDYSEGEYVMVNIDADATDDEKIAYRDYERYINRYNPEYREAQNE